MAAKTTSPAGYAARNKKTRAFSLSEIGFDETKAYVQKVMNNYRVYQQLYTVDLKRK